MARIASITAALVGALVVMAATAPAGGARRITRPMPGSLAQRSNVYGLTNAQYMTHFVQRNGSRLSVSGRPFRWSGSNVEWLGLENYGPNPSKQIPAGSERYATPYEINDAFATLHEMGANVVRVQTLGDTVGCAPCEEPALGVANPAAFHETDLVVAAARRWGIKLIGEFDGDANGAAPAGALNSQSHGWYCKWEHVSGGCDSAFFSAPRLIADYEQHMSMVLNHVNPYTGVAYRNDPTILGWVDGNNLGLLDGVSPQTIVAWLRSVSSFFKSADPKQLFIDISTAGAEILPTTPGVLQVPGVDVYAEEYYPHWFPLLQGGDRLDGQAPLLHQDAKLVAAAGKAYATIEYGWDNTNFLTQAALGQFVNGLASDPNVAGDNFWALLAHSNGHGWQPLPANAGCVPTCEELEDGNWWALYYTGVRTLSNTATDMAGRAQILRAHAYAMDGFPTTPAHETVPTPIITSTAAGLVQFEGAAGSPTYSVQRRTDTGTWSSACDQCTTDSAGGWQDPTPTLGCYRVIGVNLGGVPGPPSAPAGACRSPQTRSKPNDHGLRDIQRRRDNAHANHNDGRPCGVVALCVRCHGYPWVQRAQLTTSTTRSAQRC